MADLNSTEMARLRACLNKLAWGLAAERDSVTAPLTVALTRLTEVMDTSVCAWQDVFSVLSMPLEAETSRNPLILDETQVMMEQFRQACHCLNEALTTDQALHDLIADDDDTAILPDLTDDEEPDLADLIAAQEAQEAAQFATEVKPVSESVTHASVSEVTGAAVPTNMDTILAQLAELETVTRD